ncbi:MAG TPA: hypothetical protein VED16_03625 [Candidatus Acidoferrum sp.]|nr:hypothetical protein [Candidatus Acidoferrum sp.]
MSSSLLYCFYSLGLSRDASNVKVLSDKVNLALHIDVIHEADWHLVSPTNETARVAWKRPL